MLKHCLIFTMQFSVLLQEVLLSKKTYIKEPKSFLWKHLLFSAFLTANSALTYFHITILLKGNKMFSRLFEVAFGNAKNSVKCPFSL